MVARATGVGAGAAARAAPEALLARYDAELRLLDTVRRCVAAKLKCDRDYALALAAVATQGQKGDRQEELQGSLVAQAWRSLMAELEGAGRLLRAGADALEARALERLHSLQAEKRRTRKQLQEEHGRLASRLAHLTEDVTRKKAEYQKYLELYRLMRSRFEEHFVKSGRSGRKLDETRDKLQKACRKLHLTHNEYVLLLSEAAEFEREYRAVLLPALLQRQQAAHEAFVTSWTEVLRDVAHNISFADEALAEVQRRADAAVAAIKPSEEYAAFSDKYKNASPVAAPSAFVFDDSLAEDSSGRLLPGRLAVDNLTVESLRNKMAELEAALKEAQPVAPATADGLEPPTANGRASDPAGGGGGGGSAAGSRHGSTASEAGRAEAAEARARERTLARQLELVRGALSEQSGEELPAGCDLAALDAAAAAAAALAAPPAADAASVAGVSQGDATRPSTPAPGLPPQGDVSSFTLKRQQQRLANLLRRPFRRKSVPSTPVLGRAMGSRGGSVPADDDTAAAQVPAGGGGGGSGACGNGAGSNGGLAGRALADEDWFHGVLPREEVVRLLTREGDFLVRQTTRNDECQTVLSVCWGGHKHFIVQTTAEGHFRFEGPAFPTIPELIAHQLQSALPVTGRSGAVLRRPILRERWELNNDDVLLLDKIGREQYKGPSQHFARGSGKLDENLIEMGVIDPEAEGNFGDVYKARLKSSGQEVAVKTCRVTLPEEHRRKFLQEGRILKQYDHPNVVRLIGICVQKQPIMIVMELVAGGSLLTFLRNRAATLTQRQLLGMCRDAAAGMRYLESRNCIHRDLAARNCLVGYENIVKISDFGMSREEEEYIVSDGMKQIPIKWTAPEALNFGKYTSLCDVWSYGVLAWEIFARGGTPYSGMSNSKAREKIDAGYRMPAPEGCPDEMYRLMLRCWEYEPENRPHFEQIYLVVDTLFGAQR